MIGIHFCPYYAEKVKTTQISKFSKFMKSVDFVLKLQTLYLPKGMILRAEIFTVSTTHWALQNRIGFNWFEECWVFSGRNSMDQAFSYFLFLIPTRKQKYMEFRCWSEKSVGARWSTEFHETVGTKSVGTIMDYRNPWWTTEFSTCFLMNLRLRVKLHIFYTFRSCYRILLDVAVKCPSWDQ